MCADAFTPCGTAIVPPLRNMPVHKWLLRHIYFPAIRLGISKCVAIREGMSGMAIRLGVLKCMAIREGISGMAIRLGVLKCVVIREGILGWAIRLGESKCVVVMELYEGESSGGAY